MVKSKNISKADKTKILGNIGKRSHQLRRPIEIIEKESGEIYHFSSKKQASRYAGCSPALIYLILEKGASPGSKYSYNYIDTVDPEKCLDIQDQRIGKIRVPVDVQKINHNAYMLEYAARKRAEIDQRAADIEIAETDIILCNHVLKPLI